MIIKEVINWSFAGKLAIVVTILSFIVFVITLIPSKKDKLNLQATLEINDYNLPLIYQAHLDSIDIYDINSIINESIYKSRNSIFALIDTCFENIKASNVKLKNGDRLKLKLTLQILNITRNYIKTSNQVIKNKLNSNKIDKFYNKWGLGTIIIKNVGKKEISDLRIEFSENIYGNNGYFEIEMNNTIMEYSCFKDIINIPLLRGNNTVTIRIWTQSYTSKNTIITHPEGIIEPSVIVKTKGFYAWASKNFSTWSDFYFVFTIPLYIILVLVYSLMAYKKDNTDKENKNTAQDGS